MQKSCLFTNCTVVKKNAFLQKYIFVKKLFFYKIYYCKKAAFLC